MKKVIGLGSKDTIHVDSVTDEIIVYIKDDKVSILSPKDVDSPIHYARLMNTDRWVFGDFFANTGHESKITFMTKQSGQYFAFNSMKEALLFVAAKLDELGD